MSGSVFFYVQHLLGIGHLVRASRIAHALQEGGIAVTMAVGGIPFPGFPGRTIPTVALPPLKASAGFSGLLDAEDHPVDDDRPRPEAEGWPLTSRVWQRGTNRRPG